MTIITHFLRMNQGKISLNINGVRLTFRPNMKVEDLNYIFSQFNNIEIDKIKNLLMLQTDILPILHNSLPSIHQALISALDAINALQPQSFRIISVIPAVVEFLSSAMFLQNASDPIIVIMTLYVQELNQVIPYIMQVFDVLRSERMTRILMSLIDEVNYESSILERLRVAVLDLQVDFLAVRDLYHQQEETYRRLLNTFFDISNDLNDSLRETLSSFEKQDPNAVVFSSPDQFLPLIVTNGMRLLRRGGISAHMVELHEAFLNIRMLLKQIASIKKSKLNELVNALIALSVYVPRTEGLLQNVNDWLIDFTIVLLHSHSKVLPATIKLVDRLIYLTQPTITSTEIAYEVAPILQELAYLLPDHVVLQPLLAPFLRNSLYISKHLLNIIDAYQAIQECSLKKETSNVNCTVFTFSKLLITIQSLFVSQG